MTDRPILFSAPMVRALLAGNKTQTRRVVKGAALDWLAPDMFTPEFVATSENGLCPYGVPGDRLWVREAHALHERFTDVVRVVYAASLPGSWTEATREFPASNADGLTIKPYQEGFRPSIHMPRWASRITLEITDVRVERLNDISASDALAEGMTFPNGMEWGSDPVDAYRGLWDHINGPGAWAANPWVWVVAFRVVP
jgi:hypothetical protein